MDEESVPSRTILSPALVPAPSVPPCSIATSNISDASRIIESPSTLMSSELSRTICSSNAPSTIFTAPRRRWVTSSNRISKVEASIGENLSSGAVTPRSLNQPPPREEPAACTAAEIDDATLTLPNGAQPAGWTAFFNWLR